MPKYLFLRITVLFQYLFNFAIFLLLFPNETISQSREDLYKKAIELKHESTNQYLYRLNELSHISSPKEVDSISLKASLDLADYYFLDRKKDSTFYFLNKGKRYFEQLESKGHYK